MPDKSKNTKASHGSDVELLKSVAAFSNAKPADLKKVADGTRHRILKRGEALIRAGEKSDALYIVLRGRFLVLAKDKPIAEISVGEPIGELGFFANRDRTADVVAARASEVIELSRASYDKLTRTLPGLANSIMSAMAARLADSVSSQPKFQPRSGTNVAVLPAAQGTLPAEFFNRLIKSFKHEKSCRIISERDVPEAIRGNAAKLGEWLRNQEGKSNTLILICANAADLGWSETILAGADTMFWVGEKATGRHGAVPLSDQEQANQEQSLAANQHLVLWRDRSDRPIRSTENWLENRNIGLHHHVALDNEGDFDRLKRFMLGQARGLVLCGGGAFGTAHLGAIKALREYGLDVDMYGGTSVGAAMSAALAVGKPPDEVMDLCEEIFLRSKAMSKLTVPLHSVIDHKLFDEQMRKHYGDFCIENLPVNYFAVATSLTRNDLHLIRHGELWRAVRSSSSIPAVFPPVITDDGEVLIDGALVDNVPINVMRDLKPGPNIVLNFKKGEPWRIHSSYENLPGRGEAARRLILRKKSDQRFPTVVSVLSRTMVITARRLLEATDMRDDVLLEIPTLPRMGFLEWKRGREQFDAAYQLMSESLSKDSGADMMAHIKSAGMRLEEMARAN